MDGSSKTLIEINVPLGTYLVEGYMRADKMSAQTGMWMNICNSLVIGTNAPIQLYTRNGTTLYHGTRITLSCISVAGAVVDEAWVRYIRLG
jgi:hypothetical protein